MRSNLRSVLFLHSFVEKTFRKLFPLYTFHFFLFLLPFLWQNLSIKQEAQTEVCSSHFHWKASGLLLGLCCKMICWLLANVLYSYKEHFGIHFGLLIKLEFTWLNVFSTCHVNIQRIFLASPYSFWREMRHLVCALKCLILSTDERELMVTSSDTDFFRAGFQNWYEVIQCFCRFFPGSYWWKEVETVHDLSLLPDLYHSKLHPTCI